MAILRATTNPLTVTNQQITQLAARIQFVKHAIGEVWPRNELEAHVVAAFGFEFLTQFNQGIGWVPSGPAQGQVIGHGCWRGRHATGEYHSP